MVYICVTKLVFQRFEANNTSFTWYIWVTKALQISYDPRSYERNLCKCVFRSLKNSGLQGLNP